MRETGNGSVIVRGSGSSGRGNMTRSGRWERGREWRWNGSGSKIGTWSWWYNTVVTI